MPRPARTAGFTVIEILVVLGVVAALSAILVPIVSSYVEDGRRQRARGDLRSIGEAMNAVHRDLGVYPVFTDGGDRTVGTAASYEVLIGPGNTPSVGSGTGWTVTGSDVGSLGGQLVQNAPGGGGYPTQGRFAWRGPYIDDVSPDPWGNGYVVNAENLLPNQGQSGYVLSAGPNGQIETDFEIDRTSASTTPAGDDLLYRLR